MSDRGRFTLAKDDLNLAPKSDNSDVARIAGARHRESRV